MNRSLPAAAVLLGIAGLLPFIICGLGAVNADAERAGMMLTALLGYGAVILGFLGGVQWGMALNDADEGQAIPRFRLSLGVLPALIGWTALLSGLLLPQSVGLAILIGGFLFAVLVESHRARTETLPRFYLTLRWALSLVVIATLTTVLVMRLLGAVITF